MNFFCDPCNRSFRKHAGLKKHLVAHHWHFKGPEVPRSTFHYHSKLDARPCNSGGNFVPRNASPEPPDHESVDWTPFPDRPTFECASLLFEKMRASIGSINELFNILAAKNVLDNAGENIFASARDMYNTIDSIPFGDLPWHSFGIKYAGPVDKHSPSWKTETYVIHTRNASDVVARIVNNPTFDGKFDYTAFEEFVGPHEQRFSNLMSGRWAWKKSDVIAEDPGTHGAMLVPIVLGADKTTVSVGTGNTEFHPLYISVGNLDNSARRAHGCGLIPLSFLSIPKTCRQFTEDNEYRLFRKQLYHASIAHILSPLRDGMTSPVVLRCPDGHFRRAIYEIGPFIADYPEQVVLAGIVQGWCPGCLAQPHRGAFDDAGDPRFHAHTHQLRETFDSETLWYTYGVVENVIPFTDFFPRADIYELITPDLLHQLIKGTFKDHLVTWIQDYLELTHGSTEAKKILDDIDRRIAVVPAFPGLRRFPEGRNFKQWTGNDSKALMKVFLPAIVGYVPDAMVQSVAAFLDFCYRARHSTHTTTTLNAMDHALTRFHHYRVIFQESGIRPDGFFPPRQHSLVHYVTRIKQYGSPNGLSSSITESKHIEAVKKPWRRTNKHMPLGQILRINTRNSQLAAARTEFTRRGMLDGDVLSDAYREAGLRAEEDIEDAEDARYSDLRDAEDVDGPHTQSMVKLALKSAHTKMIYDLAQELGRTGPELKTLMQHFLFEQLYGHGEHDITADDISADDLPRFKGRLSIYHSATITFYCPTELAGIGGMRRETVRSTPRWYGKDERRDTVLVQVGPEDDLMRGMLVARVLRFVSFIHQGVRYPCAIVNWFVPKDNEPDRLTGMWIVKPEKLNGQRSIGIVHVDTIFRACQLIGVYGTTPIPLDFHFSYSLDTFKEFYVNSYVDYHAHESSIM
ncbi:hypothetical protein HETIRDRAFT_308646 [Heterobasidion irregulare TC 32-1]|uniref:C2H2-type domain-containing protein n=1 Tax=Heterobasidion irregulare (strain TC 32-1) TaxID=747525 RepID=W4KH35_HETIT|nr:uncharacterized protein HETIRDRAFT_308646 [Heterobasidion irregulare TC 32-1]ETW85029.1 hypothetical protein HETIRDRAFT_308646 [Heterobasidion irregulare TC 32-1]